MVCLINITTPVGHVYLDRSKIKSREVVSSCVVIDCSARRACASDLKDAGDYYEGDPRLAYRPANNERIGETGA